MLREIWCVTALEFSMPETRAFVLIGGGVLTRSGVWAGVSGDVGGDAANLQRGVRCVCGALPPRLNDNREPRRGARGPLRHDGERLAVRRSDAGAEAGVAGAGGGAGHGA
eukprot:1414785-Rhodomonas_salina.1